MQRPSSPAEPERGTIGPRSLRLGTWQTVERIGSGATAEVWRAVDSHGREAAIKIAKRDWHSDAAAELLRREHAALAELAHPHVVAARGLVDDGTTLALVLEYLPHGDLVPLLGGASRHWSAAARGAAAALLHLHSKGVAHCDVKPRNLVFGSDDAIRLIDFASLRPLDAPARQAGATRAYMPAAGATAEEADVFAFAALLFELETGRLPYGPSGQPRPGAAPLAAARASRSEILRAAADALRANGRGGLPALADVIESAVDRIERS